MPALKVAVAAAIAAAAICVLLVSSPNYVASVPHRIDSRNFTWYALDNAIGIARDNAYGDQAAFTTRLVDEIATNIAPNSPLQPAYVLVWKADMLCDKQETGFELLTGDFKFLHRTLLDKQTYIIAVFRKGCITMSDHTRGSANWRFSYLPSNTFCSTSWDSKVSVDCDDGSRNTVRWNGYNSSLGCGKYDPTKDCNIF